MDGKGEPPSPVRVSPCLLASGVGPGVGTGMPSKSPKKKSTGVKRPAKAASSRTRARGGAARAERRAQILEAARRVFAKRGYHLTTIDEIVGAAGVARGTFYLYFEDKRAVFGELIDRFWSRLTVNIIRIVTDDPSRSVESQVRDNLRGVVGGCLAERDMTKILLTDASRIDPAFDRRLASFYDEVTQLLTQALQDGQALGIVHDGEPRVLATLTIGALKELLIQAVNLGLGHESADRLADQVFDFLHVGYLRLEPEKRRRR